MSTKYKRYIEINSLPVNTYLLFYLYVFVIFIIANVLPVSDVNYFVFLFLGITGTSILLIKFRYRISINQNSLMLSIAVPFRVALLELKVKEIKTLEEVVVDPITYRHTEIKNPNSSYSYVFNNGNGLKITMLNGKIYTISCTDSRSIVAWVNLLKKESRE